MKSFQIPVRIGSNIKYVSLSTTNVSPLELIKKTLTKLNLQASSHGYALFERLLGIDRLILNNENVYTLWLKWSQTSTSSTESLNSKFEFVIKKCQKSSKINSLAKKTSASSRKLYELGRQLVLNDKLRVYDASEESNSEHYENMLMDTKQEDTSVYKYNCKINTDLAEAKALMNKLTGGKMIVAQFLIDNNIHDYEYLFGHYIGLDSSIL